MLRNLSGTQRYALFVLVVVVAVVIYLAVSGGFDELLGTGGDDAQQAQAEQSAAVLGPPPVAFQETAAVGDLDVAIIGIAFPDQIRADGRWREPAGRFAEVHLTLTNRSNASRLLPLDGLQLVTGDGRAYLADAGLSLGAAITAGGAVSSPPLTLQPQLTVTVVAVYEIPLDASGLELRVTGGWTDFELFE